MPEGQEVKADVGLRRRHRGLSGVERVHHRALREAHALRPARGAAGEEQQERILFADRRGERRHLSGREAGRFVAGRRGEGDDGEPARRRGQGEPVARDHRHEPGVDELWRDRSEFFPLRGARNEDHPRRHPARDPGHGLRPEAREDRRRFGAQQLGTERHHLPLGRVLGQQQHAHSRPDAGRTQKVRRPSDAGREGTTGECTRRRRRVADGRRRLEEAQKAPLRLAAGRGEEQARQSARSKTARQESRKILGIARHSPPSLLLACSIAIRYPGGCRRRKETPILMPEPP